MALKPRVVPSDRLSLKDRLSRLSFTEAAKLLGPRGRELIQRGANEWSLNPAEDVYLGDDLCRVTIPGEFDDGRAVVVTITLMAASRGRLNVNCTRCESACEHAGAVFSLLLEEKSALGLAAPPPPDALVATVRQGLDACVEEDEAGRQRLTLSMPDRRTLDQLSRALALLLVAGQAATASP